MVFFFLLLRQRRTKDGFRVFYCIVFTSYYILCIHIFNLKYIIINTHFMFNLISSANHENRNMFSMLIPKHELGNLGPE